MCRTCNRTVYAPPQLKHHREHDILKHPTQKPEELTRRLIQSRIGQNKDKSGVLIPFAESGSKRVAAQDIGIPFLSIEINEEYVEFAQKWLSVKRNAQPVKRPLGNELSSLEKSIDTGEPALFL